MCVHVCSVTQLCPTLQPHGLVAEQTLLSMGFTSKNIGRDFHFLLQGIFLTQGPNLSLLKLLWWQVGSSPLSHLGSPILCN